MTVAVYLCLEVMMISVYVHLLYLLSWHRIRGYGIITLYSQGDDGDEYAGSPYHSEPGLMEAGYEAPAENPS